PLPSSVSLCLSCHGDHRDLHSFPTRRSSDLSCSGEIIRQGRIVPPCRCPRSVEEQILEDPPGSTGEPQVLLPQVAPALVAERQRDRKSTRLNSSHVKISYAVFCLKKKKNNQR